jgi:hypothetical protein
MTTVRMMTGEVPHYRAPPVMTYPHGLLSAHSVYEFKHVTDDLFLGIITMLGVH